MSNVKGLGATKVTSLIDAFTKPFLVGGLRRSERGKTEQTDKEAATFGDDDIADLTESVELAAGNKGANERYVSDEVNGGDMVSGQVWHDPLDDEDDDIAVGEEPVSKRARMENPIWKS